MASSAAVTWTQPTLRRRTVVGFSRPGARRLGVVRRPTCTESRVAAGPARPEPEAAGTQSPGRPGVAAGSAAAADAAVTASQCQTLDAGRRTRPGAPGWHLQERARSPRPELTRCRWPEGVVRRRPESADRDFNDQCRARAPLLALADHHQCRGGGGSGRRARTGARVGRRRTRRSRTHFVMGLRPGKDPGPREPCTEQYNDPYVICILPPRWQLGRCGLSFSLRYGS